MKGSNIIPTLVIGEKFSLVTDSIFLYFLIRYQNLIQKLFGKNRLEKDTLRKLEVLFKNETKIIFNV